MLLPLSSLLLLLLFAFQPKQFRPNQRTHEQPKATCRPFHRLIFLSSKIQSLPLSASSVSSDLQCLRPHFASLAFSFTVFWLRCPRRRRHCHRFHASSCCSNWLYFVGYIWLLEINLAPQRTFV